MAASTTTVLGEKLAVDAVESPGSERDEVAEDPRLEHVWAKLDRWVLPLVTLFWLLSFLDRTNIGNAKVAGLMKDLQLTNREYSIALTVTYVPYIAAELPASLVLKKVGPHRLLPTLLTLWGIVTVCEGTISSYAGLLACRFFLGLFEGGLFPGLALYLSYFYPRAKLQLRITTFFSMAAFSGAFGGIIAYGIVNNLAHTHGHKGWQWIFIIEGAITVFVGIVSFFLWPPSVEKTRFLTQEEKAYVNGRLRADGAIHRDEAADAFSWQDVPKAFMSIHVILLGIAFFLHGTTLFSFAYFTPSILQGLGYTAAKAQLMSVPPYSVAFVVSMTTAWVSDKYRCRGLATVFGAVLGIVGFAMFLGSGDTRVQYGSLFLSLTGAYVVAPALATWNANNSAPHTRRATAIAIGFSMANTGGILSTWLLGSISPGPRYTKGTRLLLAFSVGLLVVTLAAIAYLRRENAKKRALRKTVAREEEDAALGDRSACVAIAHFAATPGPVHASADTTRRMATSAADSAGTAAILERRPSPSFTLRNPPGPSSPSPHPATSASRCHQQIGHDDLENRPSRVSTRSPSGLQRATDCAGVCETRASRSAVNPRQPMGGSVCGRRDRTERTLRETRTEPAITSPNPGPPNARASRRQRRAMPGRQVSLCTTHPGRLHPVHPATSPAIRYKLQRTNQAPNEEQDVLSHTTSPKSEERALRSPSASTPARAGPTRAADKGRFAKVSESYQQPRGHSERKTWGMMMLTTADLLCGTTQTSRSAANLAASLSATGPAFAVQAACIVVGDAE
ncbi:MFS domain-containing protein [Mycena indigotica]|uniref:MFS domain-containing protein n=1 Tax=Mycena indigotica TaxID=2126181 RepID=A0A8H6W0V7_9AGAR|nr:MFS domain-containing protein [Mycena indigotica]KAF7297483.1 MFS domain-containing protein [Mycena indigotica]